jgi:hypothetical protein
MQVVGISQLAGPCWRGSVVAGAMLKYDRRKDKWVRTYGAVFGGDLYLFRTLPKPRSYGGADAANPASPYVASIDRPKWLKQHDATVVDLTPQGIQLSFEVQSACRMRLLLFVVVAVDVVVALLLFFRFLLLLLLLLLSVLGL